MTPKKTILSMLLIAAISVVAVVLSHNLYVAIYPMIGGLIGLRLSTKIRPEVEALKSGPQASRRTRK